MRTVVMAALAVTAAACGPKAEAPRPGPNSAQPAACAGATLPVTGLCADIQPGLFGKTDGTATLYDPACKWAVAEAKRSDTEAVVFRTQQCPPTVDKLLGYRFVGDVLTAQFAHPEDGKPPYDRTAAEFFDLPAGQTAEAFALARVGASDPAEAARCVVGKPGGVANVAGEAFGVEPDAAYMADLNKQHPDEPFAACGPYGFNNDGTAYWEKRPGLVIWHEIGQEAPAWDPASFTIYTRDAAGAWAKS